MTQPPPPTTLASRLKAVVVEADAERLRQRKEFELVSALQKELAAELLFWRPGGSSARALVTACVLASRQTSSPSGRSSPTLTPTLTELTPSNPTSAR